MSLLLPKFGNSRLQRFLPLLIFLLIAATVAAVVYVTVISTPSVSPCKNVILVVLDTVRADRLGCYGNPSGITPEIDKFAKESVLFENAFSQAPWTLPSVASLFTSSYPAQHGAGGFLGRFKMLGEDAVTLAEVFQRCGASTCAIINVFFLSEKFGMTQGFGTVDSYVPLSNVDTRRAGPTTDAALRWIDQHKSKPFFLLVHYFDPHLVYDPPQPFRRRFAAPEDCDTTDYIFGTRRDIIEFRRNKTKLGSDKIARLEKLHNGEVAYVDSEVGELIEGISKRGLDKNTVIVITSDHGEEFLDHGGFEHGHTLYDELLHVPLLIRSCTINPEKENSEGTRRGSVRIQTTVRLIDIAPTVCELAGIAAEPAFTGRSLVPLMDGKQEADRSVLSEGNMWGPSGTGWRKDGLKLIIQSSSPKVQLFDVRSDPKEQENLANRHPKRCNDMMSDLKLILQTLSQKHLKARPPSLTPDEIERLRSLGYVK